MFHVYVLRSKKDGQFYTGYTRDLNERLHMHNAGRVRSTRHRVPFELVYAEQFDTRSEAIKKEIFLKSPEGGSKIKAKIRKMFPGSSMVE